MRDPRIFQRADSWPARSLIPPASRRLARPTNTRSTPSKCAVPEGGDICTRLPDLPDNQGDVVVLGRFTLPLQHAVNNFFGQLTRRQVRRLNDCRPQSLFAELYAARAQSLRHAVGEGDEHVASLRPDSLLLVGAVEERADDSPADAQTHNGCFFIS